jgi:hypothetical protein
MAAKYGFTGTLSKAADKAGEAKEKLAYLKLGENLKNPSISLGL